MLCGVFAFAQSRVVSGKVTDATGKPVPFASVLIKGGRTGVQSDANGDFTIRVNSGDVLQISQSSYKEVEIPVGSLNSITASLDLKENTIPEVIVTSAFNRKTTSRSTSANAQVVGSEQLNTIRSTNLNNALAGKVSGIQVRSQSAAALGRGTNIRLRGESAFGEGAGLIYVVDGTVLPNANDINLDDIEDVTVLQGPNAAALFGADGANGAIVITTKKARKGQKGIGVEVNTGVLFDKVYIMPNYQNEYAGGDGGVGFNLNKYVWKAGDPVAWKALDGKYYHDYAEDVSWGPRMVGQEYIPWYSWYEGHERSFTTEKLVPHPNNARSYFNTGQQLNTTVSFSKASDDYSLRASYGNINVKGMLPTTFLRRNSLNLNSSYNITNKFTVGLNVNYLTQNVSGEFDDGYSNNTTGSFNQWFHRDVDMSIVKELKGLRTPTGIWASWNHQNPNSYNPNDLKAFYGAFYWYNPYTWFDLVKIVNRNDRLYGNVSLDYKISNSVTLTGTYRKQQNTIFRERRYSTDLFESGVKTAGTNCPECYGFYGTENSFSNIESFQVIGAYNKNIKDFSINGNVGINFGHQIFKRNAGNTNGGLNIPNLFTTQNSKEPAIYFNDRTDQKNRAVFATAVFGYKNFLFVDGTVRNDWYSTLPSADNDILSKSYGASFVFSDLIKDVAPFISYGKIRASVGEVPQSIGPYVYPGFAYGVGNNQWVNPTGSYFLMATPDQVVSPTIHGAVSSQDEIGIELRFLKNRVGGSLTYYDASSKGFPTAVEITATSGFTSTYTNIGEIQKVGYDVQFMIKPIWAKNLKWEINATWSYLKRNTVVDLDGVDSVISQQYVKEIWRDGAPYLVHEEGKQWGQIFGNGMKRYQGVEGHPGNGQPILTSGGAFVTDPKVSYGSVLPKYTGGFQNRLDLFKDFTINVNIDYQYGGKYFSLSDMWGSYTGLTARTAGLNDKGNPIRDPVDVGGGKHIFGVDATGKAVDYYVEARDYYTNLYGNQAYDEFVYDLTFVKIREVSLGYNIPVDRLGIGKWLTRANFSIVARNPWLIYAKTKDFDPSEISGLGGESGGFPGTRGLGFNLKLGF